MKALLYKELKLAMHPICYVFIFTFPLMLLIPSYPIAVGFIYVLSCYPILFLGANKGQQSNDLLYTALLPVRKKDIVLARMMTVAIMQFVFMAMMACLFPLAYVIRDNIKVSAEEAGKLESLTDAGFGLDAFVSVLAFAIIGFALADIIFFPIYYKHGKSIVMSTLFTILGFITYLGVFTIALPLMFEPYKNFFSNNGSGIWIQFAFLGVALLIYAIIHFFVYKISANRLEKVDF